MKIRKSIKGILTLFLIMIAATIVIVVGFTIPSILSIFN